MIEDEDLEENEEILYNIPLLPTEHDLDHDFRIIMGDPLATQSLFRGIPRKSPVRKKTRSPKDDRKSSIPHKDKE